MSGAHPTGFDVNALERCIVNGAGWHSARQSNMTKVLVSFCHITSLLNAMTSMVLVISCGISSGVGHQSRLQSCKTKVLVSSLYSSVQSAVIPAEMQHCGHADGIGAGVCAAQLHDQGPCVHVAYQFCSIFVALATAGSQCLTCIDVMACHNHSQHALCCGHACWDMCHFCPACCKGLCRPLDDP